MDSEKGPAPRAVSRHKHCCDTRCGQRSSARELFTTLTPPAPPSRKLSSAVPTFSYEHNMATKTRTPATMLPPRRRADDDVW
mmetsp:Transcript_2520/g.7003  ORF Transcript_2520/g.7003 Transcript_2520/m.7003 type:complete len:82 (-) Transcript_2520:940-1185(-)